jgi:hypothetical protein
VAAIDAALLVEHLTRLGRSEPAPKPIDGPTQNAVDCVIGAVLSGGVEGRQ